MDSVYLFKTPKSVLCKIRIRALVYHWLSNSQKLLFSMNLKTVVSAKQNTFLLENLNFYCWDFENSKKYGFQVNVVDFRIN